MLFWKSIHGQLNRFSLERDMNDKFITNDRRAAFRIPKDAAVKVYCDYRQFEL